MFDNILAYEEKYDNLTAKINEIDAHLSALKEQMISVQQSLKTSFVLAFGKKKKLRAELERLSSTERQLLAQRSVLQDKLNATQVDEILAEEGVESALVEAPERVKLDQEEADPESIINEELPEKEDDFQIQTGVLIKYAGETADVVVPDGLTCIGEAAFGVSNVRHIVIPYGVTAIGYQAFYLCSQLEGVELPESLTEIGEQAFIGSGLTNVVIPDKVEKVGCMAFASCNNLEKVILPAALTEIDASVFAKCGRLKNIIMPDSIKEIGMLAFEDCLELERIVLPDGVRTIASGAFSGCSNLVHIKIPASITDIGDEAFKGCQKLIASVCPGSDAEDFCQKNRIKYEYSDGSVPIAPDKQVKEHTEISKLPDTAEEAKTLVAIVAQTQDETLPPPCAVAPEQPGVFDLSQVPESIRPQLNRLLNNILSAYPDRVVSSLARDHSSWAETLTRLYKKLGYPSGQALLKFYGFTVKRSVGGRSANDYKALIEELKERYPQPWMKGYTALLTENPDLRGQLKTLSNNSQALFGMSLRQYLCQEGILAKEKPLPSSAGKAAKVPSMSETPKEHNTLAAIPATTAVTPAKKNTVPEKTDSAAVQMTTRWERLFTKVILGRGKKYFYDGNVGKISREGNQFNAVLTGSSKYNVSIQIRDGAVVGMSCDCPYAGDGLSCKHEAALLYALEEAALILSAKKDKDERKDTGSKANTGKEKHASLQSKVPDLFEIPADLPEVWDAPVYQVEEIDVTGDATAEWEFTWRRRNPRDDERVLCLIDYLGDKEQITLPASINGQKVEMLGTLEKCRASRVEIPGSYGTLTGRVIYRNDHIETLVIGEGIREISANIVDDIGAKNRVKNLLVSASVIRVMGDEIYRGSRWEKYVQTPWRIIGSTMAGYGGNSTILHIPHGVKTISYIGGGDKVRNIVLSDSVTAIYDGAFASQRYLMQFECSPSLNHLGKDVFNSASPWYQQNVHDGLLIVNNLLYQYTGDQERIVVPTGVTKVCQYAFTRNKNGFTQNDILKEVILPGSVERVGEYGFYYCVALEKLLLAEGLRAIEKFAFKNCNNLALLQLPESLETLGEGAFVNCRKLREVQFGGALQTIGVYAFADCSSLQKIRLPQRLKSIGRSAFSACEALVEVHFSQSVECVGDRAFSGCSALRTVSGLQHLTEIGKHAFERCTSLEDITLPAMMGDGIARDCTALRRVVLHPDTEYIPDHAFENCTSLEEVVWSEKLCKIGRGAFKGCTRLRMVELPATLQEIEEAAFQYCTALEHVVLPATVAIAAEAFTGTPYQKNAHGDFVIVDGKLIKYQGQQKEVVLPDAVRIIGEKSFAEAWHVEKLLIGDRVQTIEGHVFGYSKTNHREYPLLKELVIGKAVEKIGYAAFANCLVLSNVLWNSSICEIDKYAFAKCPITTMDLSKTKLQVLTESVFENVRAEKVSFPTYLKRIEADAFKQASHLSSVDLSDTQVTYIGNSAFEKCGSLNKVAFPATLTMIMRNAFAETALDRVELPVNMVRTDSNAFGKATELVVYDNLVTSDHTQPPEDGRTHWFRHSKHAIETVLTYPDYLKAEQQDSLFAGSFITVKDSQTEQIMYRIYINKAEREDLRREFRDAWQPAKHLDFSVYDKQFLRTWNVYARIEIAFCRLQYPYELSEQYRRMYEAWLERCLFIESSATRVAEVLSLRDDIGYLELLERYQALSPERLPILTKTAEKYKAKQCCAWLKKWSAGREDR